jgi:uncharacterized protein (TIGR02231 family)
MSAHRCLLLLSLATLSLPGRALPAPTTTAPTTPAPPPAPTTTPPPAPTTMRPDRIDHVVVFADRAEVTRVAEARCVAGAAAVVFAQLPDSLDTRALRAEADDGAVTVGVATTRVEQREALDARVKSLQDELLAVDVDIADVQHAREDDGQRQRAWQSYGAWFRSAMSEELRQPKPDLARFEQLLSTLGEQTVSATNDDVARGARLRTLQRRRERLAHRLDRLGQLDGDAPARLDATVSVRCGSSTTPTVRLAYVVPAARWNPEYDLRFAAPDKQKVGDGKATLTVAGVIAQSTGEDWTDAEVWLSTAKPKLGGEAPLPNPIWVTGAPETKGKTLVQAEEERAADLGAGTGGGGGPRAAALDDGGKSFLLKLPRRVTVRADGRPYWFPVDDLATKARSSLVAWPALTPSVHQVASFANPAGFPLVEGTVHVFRNGTFVGDEPLPYRAPGEPIELSVGVDDDLALARIDLLGGRREAGFFSGSQSIAQGFRTELKNRSVNDVVVEVREQVPVSKSADITVKVHKDKTSAGFTLDDVRGHLTWKVAIKRGATERRDLQFEIALPKDWAVR